MWKITSHVVWGTALNRITDWEQNGLEVRNVTSLTEVPIVNEGGGGDVLHWRAYVFHIMTWERRYIDQFKQTMTRPRQRRNIMLSVSSLSSSVSASFSTANADRQTIFLINFEIRIVLLKWPNFHANFTYKFHHFINVYVSKFGRDILKIIYCNG
jgi:hypothetical protein